jgi:hypothetical protein
MEAFYLVHQFNACVIYDLEKLDHGKGAVDSVHSAIATRAVDTFKAVHASLTNILKAANGKWRIADIHIQLTKQVERIGF